eukprot:4064643-Pyramimonas_sp.AAC.1
MPSCDPWPALGALLGALGAVLGISRAPLGAVSGHLGAIFKSPSEAQKREGKTKTLIFLRF